MRDSIHRTLSAMGLPDRDLRDLPNSSLRFPDGGQYRIEIPSTEGGDGLRTVIEAARAYDVPVHRVSQGSGVLMLTDAELADMADVARTAKIELSLFARPNAGWSASASSMSEAGGSLVPLARGADQLVDCLEDIVRAADAGVRNVLIGDPGVLAVFARMRADGELPAEMQAKVSVMMPAANPASARLYTDLGADSLNLPTDLELGQIAAIRAATTLPLDIYVEAPANLGGFIQLNRIHDIVRIAAPVHLKFGLRNGPDVYPVGHHLHDVTMAMARERVHRARLGLEVLARSGYDATMSPLAGADLRVPVAPSTSLPTHTP